MEPGALEVRDMLDAGFAPEEISVWETGERNAMLESGFTAPEINTYFGRPPVDPKSLKTHFTSNIKAASQPAVEGGAAPRYALQPHLEPAKPGAPPVRGIMDAFKFGWGESALQYLLENQLGTEDLRSQKRMDENNTFLERAAANVGMLLGDFPLMVGAALAVGGPVNPVGAAAAAFAVPTAIRSTYRYEAQRGSVQSAQEFADMAVNTLWESSKAFIEGGAMAGAGGQVTRMLRPIASPGVVFAGATTAEVATLVTVSAALEGQLPHPMDFVDAAAVIVGLKGAVKVSGDVKTVSDKLWSVYEETGRKPAEVLRDMEQDITISQHLLAKEKEIPLTYAYDAGNAPEVKPPQTFQEILTEAKRASSEAFQVKMAAPEVEGGPVPGAKMAGKGPLEEKLEAVKKLDEGERGSAPLGGAPLTPVEIAQRDVLSHLVSRETGAKIPTLEQLYTEYVDNLNPIRKAVEEWSIGKEELPTGENPYELERLTRGVHGKGTHFLNFGTYDPITYENTGPSYADILKPIKDDMDGFRAYMTARRAIEVEKKGLESGIPIDAAKILVKAGKAKFEETFQARIKYRDELLNYLQKTGILTEESVATLRSANKAYVPFYRFFEDQGKVAGGTAMRNPIKTMVGSKREIYDPIQSDIRDTFLFIALAEKNLSRQSFAALGPPYAVPKVTKVAPIKLTDPELDRFMRENEIEGDPKAFTIFREARRPLANDEIAVYENGDRTLYNVHPEVARAFNAADSVTAGFLSNMMSVPAKLLRAGTVFNPSFFGTNIMRDAIDAFIFAGSNPIKTAKGAWSLLRQDTAYQNWVKGGGSNATMVAMDRDYANVNLFKLHAETKLMTRAWNVLSSPLDVLRATSEFLENATRLGTIRAELMKPKDKAQIQALALISRNATVDFSKHGANEAWQEFTHMTAFLNPGIQGMARMFEAFGEDVRAFKAGEAKEVLTGITAKAFVSITLPSIYLWWKNHDQDWYKALPQWQKDLFWPVKVGDVIYRIPKPFQLGLVFGTLPERLLTKFFTDDPNAFARFEETMANVFGVSMIPTWAAPIAEQWGNRSFFTGNPTIPSDLEKLLPEYQYTEYTTETIKKLGALMGAFPGMKKASIGGEGEMANGVARALTSPILLENYLRAWTGGLGTYALALTDKALRDAGVVPDPVKPTATLSDIPVIKAFVVRYPSSTMQPIQDFFDTYYERRKVFDTIMAKAKEGDLEAVQKSIAFDRAALVQLTAIREALTQQSMIIRNIMKNPEISPDEKRQLIDTTYFRMLELAEHGNQGLAQVQKQMDTAPAVR